MFFSCVGRPNPIFPLLKKKEALLTTINLNNSLLIYYISVHQTNEWPHYIHTKPNINIYDLAAISLDNNTLGLLLFGIRTQFILLEYEFFQGCKSII